MFLATPLECIALIRRGVPAEHILALANKMQIFQPDLIRTLCLPVLEISQKIQEKIILSQEESERVLGMDYLIGQAENLAHNFGTAKGFNPARWISAWLFVPQPELGNEMPGSLMDTVEGQKFVPHFLAKNPIAEICVDRIFMSTAHFESPK